MTKTLLDKRIPTILGIVLLLVGIITASLLAQNGVRLAIDALPGQPPQNIQISNIAGNSITISYTTAVDAVGIVNIGKTASLDKRVLDDRDQKSPKPHRAHHLTAKGLEPETTYFFSIVSGDTTFLADDNKPFTVTTGPEISQAKETQPSLKGKVLLIDGTNAAETLVYLKGPGSQVISPSTESDGNYDVPLTGIRVENLQNYLFFTQTDQPSILRITDGSVLSTVTLNPAKTNPVPTIVLSNDYNFILNPFPLANQDTAPVGFPTTTKTNGEIENPQITTPEEKETLADQQPRFEGTALPNQDVEITIESQQTVETTVKADVSGNWSYRPSSPLEPGNHTIIIKTQDASGILQTITRSFSVFAQGSQFIEPSVSPRPTATRTPTPTPTAVKSPTPTATKTPTPTLTKTPTLTPTRTPTPTRTLTPTKIPTPKLSPTSTPIQSGLTPTSQPSAESLEPGDSLFVFALLGAIALLGAGLFFFLLSRDRSSL